MTSQRASMRPSHPWPCGSSCCRTPGSAAICGARFTRHAPRGRAGIHPRQRPAMPVSYQHQIVPMRHHPSLRAQSYRLSVAVAARWKCKSQRSRESCPRCTKTIWSRHDITSEKLAARGGGRNSLAISAAPRTPSPPSRRRARRRQEWSTAGCFRASTAPTRPGDPSPEARSNLAEHEPARSTAGGDRPRGGHERSAWPLLVRRDATAIRTRHH
jgi:hypothetical protein